ncbi:MAG: hypothetical protein NC127_04480 [Muribaculum sp.]|nr:hypothetical protein [Muribaculum sp.]
MIGRYLSRFMSAVATVFLSAVLVAPAKAVESDKILVAYFSWGGNTKAMAEYISEHTGGELFRIVPLNAYPSDLNECYAVALDERETDARPAISSNVAEWDKYEVIFLGCPVWWHEAPMIIHTFVDSYDFYGKTVVPFCTYASSYRDATLAKIVELTPYSAHLEGFGAQSDHLEGVLEWLDMIGLLDTSTVDEVGISSDSKVEVYALSGRAVFRGAMSEVVNLPRGVYIVRSAGSTYKVRI